MRALTLAMLIGGVACADDLVELKAGGRLVARYQPAATPMKPYVKELFSPAGVNVTIDSPADHFHHHGLMFAVGAGEVDFWSEKPFERFGQQRPLVGATKAAEAGLLQVLYWTAPDGRVLLHETRRVMVADGPDANVVTWITELAPAEEKPVKLWGRHYFGLGIRFPADMDAKASFLLAPDAQAGRLVRGDEQVRPASWCAAAGTIGGKPVTVAMWDDPKNARRVSWFTMSKPFSYLAATLNLEQEPLAVVAGPGLALRYAVAVFDGPADAARIEKARADWLATIGSIR